MADSTHGRGLGERDLTFAGGEVEYPVYTTPTDRFQQRGELYAVGTLVTGATNNSRHHLVIENPAGSGKVVDVVRVSPSAGAGHTRRFFTPGSTTASGTLSARNWNRKIGADAHQTLATYGTIDQALTQNQFPAPAVVNTEKNSPGPLSQEQFSFRLGEDQRFGVEVALDGAANVAVVATFAEFDASP